MDGKRASLQDVIQQVRSHPDINKAGMILIHNGFVRASDKSGSRHVEGVFVEADRTEIKKVLDWASGQPGIVAVAIEAFDGDLHVGDDLLFIVIAGDIRENVFPVMRETIERIKGSGVKKREIYR
jgi:molybdopterin synthase catalytic subunit